MAEFGHIGAIGNGCCIDAWGAGPFVITAAGKSYRFEDSDRFGPYWLTKAGDISERQPGERHPFWKAHRAWFQQGRRMAEDGMTCLYDDLRPTVIGKRGRKWVVILHGDDDGPVLTEDSIEGRSAMLNAAPSPALSGEE